MQRTVPTVDSRLKIRVLGARSAQLSAGLELNVPVVIDAKLVVWPLGRVCAAVQSLGGDTTQLCQLHA